MLNYGLNNTESSLNWSTHDIQCHVNAPSPVKFGCVPLKQTKQAPTAIEQI